MNRSFLQLPQQKRLQIINSALEEFAQYGFDNASTNRIVKASEISKGSLFNYFGSKKDLYLSMAKYCLDVLMKELPTPTGNSKIDLLKSLEEISAKKVEVYQKNPKLFSFIFSSIQENSAEVKESIQTLYSDNHETFAFNMYERLDTSLFKEGLDIEMAYKTINHALESISRRYQEEAINLDLDKSKEEIQKFLDFFRNVFYR